MYHGSFGFLRGMILREDEGALISIDDLLLRLNTMEASASYDSVRKVFSDLSREQEVMRICNGIYRRVNSAFPNALPAPSTDEILKVIARDNNWVIRPGTEMAREMLGLSFDSAHNDIYACSGSTYDYKLDSGSTIRLRKYSGKFMTSPAVTEKAALVTIALMDLANHSITAEELAHLSATLTKEEKYDLIKASPHIPARLRPVFEIICGIYGIGGR